MLTLWGHLDQWLAPVKRRLRAAVGATSSQRAVTSAEPTLFDQAAARGRGRKRDRSAPPPLRGAGRRPATAARATVAQVPVRTEKRRSTAQERYDEVVRRMLGEHGVRVKRWRKSMSGVAWQLRYRDGTVAKLIESPRPKGPMSAAIFLHEIGHHVIGFNRYKPRCLEEYHAWAWSLAAMESHGLEVTEAVRHRMADSLWYAVSKAQRRGLRELPPELMAFTTRPPRRKKGSGRSS